MRIYPIFKIVRVTGGGAGGTAGRSTGTETDSLTTKGVLGARSLGTDTRSLAHSGVLSQSVGTDSRSLAFPSLTGSGARSTGTNTGSLTHAAQLTRAIGTDSRSLAWFNSLSQLRNYGKTATQTRNAGNHDWLNPTNAQGVSDGTSATITCQATNTSGDSADATLKIATASGATPPTVGTQFINRNVFVVIDATLSGSPGTGGSINVTIRVTKSDGSASFSAWSTNIASNPPTSIDITSSVSSWSDTEVANARIEVLFVASLLLVTGTAGVTMTVDDAGIQFSMFRSGTQS